METIGDRLYDFYADWIEEEATPQEISDVIGMCEKRLRDMRDILEAEKATNEEEINIINGVLGDGDMSSDDLDGDESENGCDCGNKEHEENEKTPEDEYQEHFDIECKKVLKDMRKGIKMFELRKKYSDKHIEEMIENGIIIKKGNKYVQNDSI